MQRVCFNTTTRIQFLSLSGVNLFVVLLSWLVCLDQIYHHHSANLNKSNVHRIFIDVWDSRKTNFAIKNLWNLNSENVVVYTSERTRGFVESGNIIGGKIDSAGNAHVPLMQIYVRLFSISLFNRCHVIFLSLLSVVTRSKEIRVILSGKLFR